MARRSGWIIGLVMLAVAGQAQALQMTFININQLPPPLQFVSSQPAASASLNAPPQAVSLTFSQPLDPNASSLIVYDPYNNALTTGEAQISNTTLSVSLPEFKPGYSGTYRVEWKTHCLCNDVKDLSGSFSFTIL